MPAAAPVSPSSETPPDEAAPVSPPVVLAPGDYFVVCANAANTPNCDLDDGPDTNFVQNGAPDAVALVIGATVIDAVSYEGDTAAPYTEGSGAGLEDSGAADHETAAAEPCRQGASYFQRHRLLACAPIGAMSRALGLQHLAGIEVPGNRLPGCILVRR